MAESIPNTVLQQVQQLLHLYRLGEVTDGELLHRYCTDRDEKAFAALLERHGPMVLGICRRLLRQSADMEDAFQAVFLVLVRKAPSLPASGSLAGWLYTVACRLALRVKIRTDRSTTFQRPIEEVPEPASTPGCGDGQLREVLDAELLQMPEKYRTPLILCYLEGRTYAEAAQQLGWKDGTVSSRLARAKELLRQRLLRRGLQLAVGAGSVVTAADAVPAGLAGSACKVAVPAAVGQAVAGGSSERALLLAEEMLRTMTTTKLKLAAGLMLAVGLLGAGTGLALHGAGGEEPNEQPAVGQGTLPVAARTVADGPKQPRVDSHGDLLPDGAIARLGTVRFRHAGPATTVVFAPDGNRLASGSADGTVSIWDATTGKELRQFQGHQNGVNCVVFAPDGKTLASASRDRTVRLWDPASGKEVHQISRHLGSVLSVAFAPDGKNLASADRCVHSWDTATAKELRPFPGLQDAVWSVAYAPDGKTLASASSDGTIGLWNATTGKLVRRVQGHQDQVLSVAYAPDGKALVSASRDRTVRLWDVATGKEFHQLRGHQDQVLSVAYAPDGKTLASASQDRTVRLWDVATGKELHQFRGHQDQVLSVAYAPDSKTLASASRDRTVRIWDVATGKEVPQFQGHQGIVTTVAYAPDGKTVASASEDRTVRLWDTATGKELQLLQATSGPIVSSGAFSPDAKTWASGSLDKSVRLCEAITGKELRQFQGHQGLVTSVAFAPDGKTLATASGDRSVRLWDVATGKELRQFVSMRNGIKSVVFAPNGKVLAAAIDDGGTVWLVDPATGRPIREIQGHEGQVTAVAFAPDSKLLAAASLDMTVRLWSLATGKECRQFQGHRSVILSVTFAPDGKTLTTGSADGTLLLWETATGKERGVLRGQAGSVHSVVWSPDSRQLATAHANTTLMLWDGFRVPDAARREALPAKALQAGWTDLASDDAVQAFQAIRLLAAHPAQAVTFLQERLKPVAPFDPKRAAQLIADLESNEFPARQMATMELERLGDPVVPALEKALAGKPALETCTRIERLLEKADRMPSPEVLRTLRAVEALEHAGSPEARQLLETLAKGDNGARLTREALASLHRLAKTANKAKE